MDGGIFFFFSFPFLPLWCLHRIQSRNVAFFFFFFFLLFFCAVFFFFFFFFFFLKTVRMYSPVCCRCRLTFPQSGKYTVFPLDGQRRKPSNVMQGPAGPWSVVSSPQVGGWRGRRQ